MMRLALCVAAAVGVLSLAPECCAPLLSQSNGSRSFDRALALEDSGATSASVSIGDVNADQHLDIVLVKGRHWPLHELVLLGVGDGSFHPAYPVGEQPDRSYSGVLVDIDRDGDLDLVVSNDRPDSKIVHLNDGQGRFLPGGTFGRGEWSTRYISVTDLNGDWYPDVVLANRYGREQGLSHICFGEPGGSFAADCVGFALGSATTITPADVNGDGFPDLVVPHRDGGQSYVYRNDGKGGFTERRPFGPVNAAIRSAEAVDLDGDGAQDIVAIDQRTGPAIFWGRSDGTYADAESLGSGDPMPYALAVADVDRNGRLDVIVGYVQSRPVIYFNDGPEAFSPVPFGDAEGTAYGFAVGDLDEDGLLDIAMARSDARNMLYFGAPARTLTYPNARRDNVVDIYHGTSVADPYRWLEQMATPEVRAWTTAQNDLMVQQVRSDSTRDWFLQRMKHHAKMWDQFDNDEGGLVVNGNEFRLHATPGESYRLLLIKSDGSSDSARVFIDPRTFGPQHSIVRFQVAPDGEHVSYALSVGGSEWVETRIRRVSDGVDLPERITGMLGIVPLWSRDSRGFFYVHQQRPTDARVMLTDPSVRYHVIDTPQSSDRVIFATPAGSVESVLQISYASDRRYLVIAEGSGAVWQQFAWALSRMYLLDLGADKLPALANPVVPMMGDKVAGYRLVGSEGSTLYLMTDRDAPRKRVVAVDVRDPAPDRWRDVIPEDSTLVLFSIGKINNRFVGVYLSDVQPLIRIFEADGRLLHTITLPPLSNLSDLSPGDTDSTLSAATVSFLHAPRFWDISMATGAMSLTQTFVTDFDSAAYLEKQVWFASKDGTRVPMFVVHRNGIAMDGSHPVLMLGYGASGQVQLPEFSEHILAWLEAGGIFATPNLRGGGEFGREWYDAAILDRKQNTIDDFIAAAEFLIAEGYTTPARLAIIGASNGGQLVSATITQRPDLFGAAIAEVPITDNLRYDRGRHRGQFGHVSDSTQFEILYRYSPLHRVEPGTCYPATLITTVANDDRAPAWQAFKFAASLQYAQHCSNPILLRVIDVGGHMGDRGPDSWLDDVADALAFAAQQTGMRVRSPK